MSTLASTRDERTQARSDGLKQSVEEGIAKLEQELLQGHSESFLKALKWWGSLHKYSFQNSLLILFQRPDATLVAGFNTWRRLGFTVRKGEKAIWLLGPVIKKVWDPATNSDREKLMGFTSVSVFAIEQTKEYPDKQPPDAFAAPTGDLDFEDFYIKSCRRLQTLHGITVKELEMGSVYGMASSGGIWINRRHDFDQKVASLIHEIAHIVAGHVNDVSGDRRQQEMEAEASTMIVCCRLGIDHRSAADYLINYEIQPGELKGNINNISLIVREISKKLDIIQPTKEDAVLSEAA